MSTVAIFNGYGQYEQNEHGQKGITLSHGGVPFWFPFDKVSYIPDWTMREVDHDASTANGEEEGVLTYKTFRLDGRRVAEELLETQIPFKNSYKGIILISNEKEKRKNSYVEVPAGVSDDGQRLTAEVQEIEPTQYEIAEAHRRAREFKEETIQLYFQGKRERLAGGFGPIFPTGLIKVYMKELGVKDIDDVTRQLETAAATPGLSIEQLLLLVKEIIGAKDAAKPAPAQLGTTVPVQSAESLI